MRLSTTWSLLLSSAGLAVAQTVSNCPAGSDSSAICYSINVPTSSASSGSGDIFFQIKGPTSRSWIALGQGTEMAGSNIFVVYPNSDGSNMTLSPRTGVGEVEPKFNSNAQVTLLSGSGISGGIMTANVKCSNCNSWTGGSMSFTDSSSNWIWSSAEGAAVSSDDTSADISQHDEQGTIKFDLTKASSTSASTTNPFVTTSGTPATPSSSSGSSNVGSSASSSSVDFSKLGSVTMAHASVMSLAFLFFFPLGAIIMRVRSFRGSVWIHAGIQIFSYALAIAGLGMGIWMAQSLQLLNAYHAIIGLVTVCLLIFQAPLGLLHHKLYKSRGGRTAPSYVHIWLGRALMTLGAINGAFGLTLANDSKNGLIAYGTIAGIIYVGYYIVIALTAGKRTKTNPQGEKRAPLGERGGVERVSGSASSQ